MRIRCMSTMATHSTIFIPVNHSLLGGPGGAITSCGKGQERKGKVGRVERVGGWRVGRLQSAKAVKGKKEWKVKVQIKAKVMVTLKWNGVVPTCDQSDGVLAHLAPRVQTRTPARSDHTPLPGQKTPHSMVRAESSGSEHEGSTAVPRPCRRAEISPKSEVPNTMPQTSQDL